MDEATERKIRDLKLKILRVEKELAATQHHLNLGAWLRAGHAGQLAKTAERDRKRLEGKLEELRAKLHELSPAPVESPVKETPKAEEPPPPAQTKKKPVTRRRKPS